MERIKLNLTSLLIFLLLMAMIVYSAATINKKASAESVQTIEANIRKAAVTCYAIEGAYPQSLDYLEENYGLKLDRGRYAIEYDIVGSNIMPWIAVAEKGTYYFDKGWD